ncbi:MAG TPA: PQQ-dependent sugar dehydrogenase [Actinomycetota bacterium]
MILSRLAALTLLVPLMFTGASSAEEVVGNGVLLTPVGVYAMPVDTAIRPGEDAIYIVEKVGLIHAIRGGIPDPIPVLDVSDEVSSSLEQGLLGLAFSPDGTNMYVNLTDPDGDTRVLEFAMDGGVADEASRRELMQLDQPFENHNAGHLAFGPDGYLYGTLGDGGSGGDPMGNGQNIGSLLGSIFRIDPTPTEDAAYTIPADNPFVGVEGAREEIWAYGLRNPWKFSFDRVTGDLWIADVGQNLWEEIDVQPADAGGGQNYGWNQMEATHPYEGGVEPDNHVPPVFEYGHEGGACSITGGYVYRGDAIPSLVGAYLYGDWCEGSVHALRVGEDGAVDEDLGLDVPLLASFGEDPSGEVYALSLAGPVFRIDLLPA